MDDQIQKNKKRKKIIIISIISFVVLVSIIFSIIYYKKKKAAEDALKNGAPTGDLNDRNYKPKPIFNDKENKNGNDTDKNKGIYIDGITNKQNGVDGDIINVPGDLYGKGKNKTKISSSSLTYSNLNKLFGEKKNGVDLFNPVNDTGGFLALIPDRDPNTSLGQAFQETTQDIVDRNVETVDRLNEIGREVNRILEEQYEDLKNPDKKFEEALKNCRRRLNDKWRAKFGIDTNESLLALISTTSAGQNITLTVSTTSEIYKTFEAKRDFQDIQLNAFFGDFLNFLLNSEIGITETRNSFDAACWIQNFGKKANCWKTQIFGGKLGDKLKAAINGGEVKSVLGNIFSTNGYNVSGDYNVSAETVLSSITDTIKKLQPDGLSYQAVGRLKEMGHVNYTNFKFSIRYCDRHRFLGVEWEDNCRSEEFKIPLDMYQLDALVIKKDEIEAYASNMREINQCVEQAIKEWDYKKEWAKETLKNGPPPKIETLDPNKRLDAKDFDTSAVKAYTNAAAGVAHLVCLALGLKYLGTGLDSSPCSAVTDAIKGGVFALLDTADLVKSFSEKVSDRDQEDLIALANVGAVEGIQEISKVTINQLGNRKGTITNVFTKGKSYVNNVNKYLKDKQRNDAKAFFARDSANPNQKKAVQEIVNEERKNDEPFSEIDIPLVGIAKDEICNDEGEGEKQKGYGFYKIQIKQGTSDYVEIPSGDGDNTTFIWQPWDEKKKTERSNEYKNPIADTIDIEEYCKVDVDKKTIQTAYLDKGSENYNIAIASNKEKAKAIVVFLSLAEGGYGGPRTKEALNSPINSKYNQNLKIKKQLEDQKKKTEENERLKLLANGGVIGQEKCLDADGNEKGIDPTDPNNAYCDRTESTDDEDSAYKTKANIDVATKAILDATLAIANQSDSDPSCITDASKGSLVSLVNNFGDVAKNLVSSVRNIASSITNYKAWRTQIKAAKEATITKEQKGEADKLDKQSEALENTNEVIAKKITENIIKKNDLKDRINKEKNPETKAALEKQLETIEKEIKTDTVLKDNNEKIITQNRETAIKILTTNIRQIERNNIKELTTLNKNYESQITINQNKIKDIDKEIKKLTSKVGEIDVKQLNELERKRNILVFDTTTLQNDITRNNKSITQSNKAIKEATRSINQQYTNSNVQEAKVVSEDAQKRIASSKCLAQKQQLNFNKIDALVKANKGVDLSDAVQDELTNSLTYIASTTFGLNVNAKSLEDLVINGSYIERDPNDPTEYNVEIRNNLNPQGLLLDKDLIVYILYKDNKKNKQATTSKKFTQKFSELSAVLIADLKNKGIDKLPKSGNIEILDERRYKDDSFVKNYKKNLNSLYEKQNNGINEARVYYVYEFTYTDNFEKEYKPDKTDADFEFSTDFKNKTLLSCLYANGFSKVYDEKNKQAAVVYVCKYLKK